MVGSSDRLQSGFTLLEVLVALAVLIVLVAGVAPLFGRAVAAGHVARTQTSATLLAAARMEQLRSLAWTYEPPIAAGPAIPYSDLSTDLSVDPPSAGGRGLQPSPAGTLDANRPPYVDFLDAHGRWVGTGTSPPPGAAFIRRWAIEPLPDDPSRTLILRVLVVSVRRGIPGVFGAASWRSGEDALLVTVRTRKTR